MKFKFITPFTEVWVEVPEEDEDLASAVEEWLHEKCGTPSPKRFEMVNQMFEKKREEIKKALD